MCVWLYGALMSSGYQVVLLVNIYRKVVGSGVVWDIGLKGQAPG